MRFNDKDFRRVKFKLMQHIVAYKENIKGCEMFNQKADEYYIKLRCYEGFLKALQELEDKAIPEEPKDKKKGGKE